MSSKTFLTISKKECLVVYKDILANSDKSWGSAKTLADANDYGSGISIAIISIEELIKGVVIYFDGKGFDFRSIKGINTFFRNHEVRYVIAYLMFAISLLGDEVLKFLKKVKADPDGFAQQMSEIKKDEGCFEKKFKFYIFRKWVILKRELIWFSKVDIFRQEGFYSDYKDQLKSPLKISEQEYKEVINRLSKVREIGKGIITAIENNPEIEQLSKLKNSFKKENYYMKIEKGLTLLKTNKQRPFEFLIAKLNSFNS